ncbi:MAG TPA: outer membrane beta-barrel protein [Methylocella sp.]|jgi:opacity protein-like surface antigen|nr:outer membrane beta-barrel protein [Methylocella sp.]
MRHAIFAGFVLTCLGGAAGHAESPWYLSGSVGGYFREGDSGPVTITNHIITAPGTLKESYDPGIIANLALGYRLPARFRVELEAGYAEYQAATVNPSSAPFPTLRGQDFNRQSGGQSRRDMGTVNVFYDLPIAGQFVPYVGGGIGGEHGELTRAVFADANGNRFDQSGGESTRGVAVVEGGVTITLSPAFAVVPAYRYLRIFGGGAGFNASEAAHIVKLGLRYSF